MRESFVEMTEFVLPNDANAHGTVFGGRVAQWVDIAASIAAMRHCRTPVVTASMGQLDFLSPVKVGQIVILKGSVIAVGNSSMEVQIEILSEDPQTGRRCPTGTALLTVVAVDKNGNHVRVPRLRAETEDEKRRMQIGTKRIEARKK